MVAKYQKLNNQANFFNRKIGKRLECDIQLICGIKIKKNRKFGLKVTVKKSDVNWLAKNVLLMRIKNSRIKKTWKFYSRDIRLMENMQIIEK